MAPPRRFVETEETFHFFNEDAVLGTNEIRSGDASSSSSDSDSSEISRLRRAHRRRRASSVASRRTSRRLSRLLNGSVVSELESLQDDSDEDDYDSLDDFELEDDDEEIHQPRERKESTDKADAEPHNTPPAAVANTKVPGVGAVTFEQIFEPFRDLYVPPRSGDNTDWTQKKRSISQQMQLRRARRAITAFTRRVHCANAYRYRKQSEFMRVCYQRALEAGPGYEVVETSKLSDKLNEGKKQALLVASQKEDAVETTVPSLFPRKWPHLPFRSVFEWHSDTDAAIEFLSRLAELPETSLIYEPIDAGKFAAEVTELLELTRSERTSAVSDSVFAGLLGLFAMGVQLQSFTLLSKAALQFIELGQATYLGDADGGSIRPELQKLLELYCSRLAQHVAEPILAATFPRDLSAQWKVCSYQPSTSDAIATDGLYLYIFGRSGLFKIGTGNGTTVRDFVYAHNKEYVRSRDAERSWLCCIGDALYCRTIVMPGHRVDRIHINDLQNVQELVLAPNCALIGKGTTESSVYAMVTDGVDLFTIRCIDTYKKSSCKTSSSRKHRSRSHKSRKSTPVSEIVNAVLKKSDSDLKSPPQSPEAVTINVGDRVVRGPDWKWSNQDGEKGSSGTVERISTWGGVKGSGVTVRWDKNQRVNTYRWGAEGCYDLYIVVENNGLLERKPLPNAKSSRKVKNGEGTAEGSRENEPEPLPRHQLVLYRHKVDSITSIMKLEEPDIDLFLDLTPSREKHKQGTSGSSDAKSGVETLSALHSHTVTLCSSKTSWMCDGGMSNCFGDNAAKRYRCTSGCDFDLCESCLFATVIDKPSLIKAASESNIADDGASSIANTTADDTVPSADDGPVASDVGTPIESIASEGTDPFSTVDVSLFVESAREVSLKKKEEDKKKQKQQTEEQMVNDLAAFWCGLYSRKECQVALRRNGLQLNEASTWLHTCGAYLRAPMVIPTVSSVILAAKPKSGALDPVLLIAGTFFATHGQLCVVSPPGLYTVGEEHSDKAKRAASSSDASWFFSLNNGALLADKPVLLKGIPAGSPTCVDMTRKRILVFSSYLNCLEEYVDHVQQSRQLVDQTVTECATLEDTGKLIISQLAQLMRKRAAFPAYKHPRAGLQDILFRTGREPAPASTDKSSDHKDGDLTTKSKNRRIKNIRARLKELDRLPSKDLPGYIIPFCVDFEDEGLLQILRAITYFCRMLSSKVASCDENDNSIGLTAAYKLVADLLRILMETVQEFEFVGVTMNIDASDEATQELFKDTEHESTQVARLRATLNDAAIFGGYQVVETPHPYNHTQPVFRRVVHIPGASVLHFEFDPRCRTSGEADIVFITSGLAWYQADRLPYGDVGFGEDGGCFFGSYSRGNWPAGGLTVVGDTATIMLCATTQARSGTGDKQRWGLKCTVRGLFGSPHRTWLPELGCAVANACSVLGGKLLRGLPPQGIEKACQPWVMQRQLFNLAAPAYNVLKSKWKFVNDVVNHTERGDVFFSTLTKYVRLRTLPPRHSTARWNESLQEAAAVLLVRSNYRQLDAWLASVENHTVLPNDVASALFHRIAVEMGKLERWMLRQVQLVSEWHYLCMDEVSLDELMERYADNLDRLSELCQLKSVVFKRNDMTSCVKSIHELLVRDIAAKHEKDEDAYSQSSGSHGAVAQAVSLKARFLLSRWEKCVEYGITYLESVTEPIHSTVPDCLSDVSRFLCSTVSISALEECSTAHSARLESRLAGVGYCKEAFASLKNEDMAQFFVGRVLHAVPSSNLVQDDAIFSGCALASPHLLAETMASLNSYAMTIARVSESKDALPAFRAVALADIWNCAHSLDSISSRVLGLDRVSKMILALDSEVRSYAEDLLADKGALLSSPPDTREVHRQVYDVAWILLRLLAEEVFDSCAEQDGSDESWKLPLKRVFGELCVVYEYFAVKQKEQGSCASTKQLYIAKSSDEAIYRLMCTVASKVAVLHEWPEVFSWWIQKAIGLVTAPNAPSNLSVASTRLIRYSLELLGDAMFDLKMVIPRSSETKMVLGMKIQDILLKRVGKIVSPLPVSDHAAKPAPSPTDSVLGEVSDHCVVIFQNEVATDKLVDAANSVGEPDVRPLEIPVEGSDGKDAVEKAITEAVAECTAAQATMKHPSVRCDGCNQSPLRGFRFKCFTCPNYDLCTSCYTNQTHNMDHPFVRLTDTAGTGDLLQPRSKGGSVVPETALVGSKPWKGNLLRVLLDAQGYVIYCFGSRRECCNTASALANLGFLVTVAHSDDMADVDSLHDWERSMQLFLEPGSSRLSHRRSSLSSEKNSARRAHREVINVFNRKAALINSNTRRSSQKVEDGRQLASEVIAVLRLMASGHPNMQRWRSSTLRKMTEILEDSPRQITEPIGSSSALCDSYFLTLGATQVLGRFREPLRIGGNVSLSSYAADKARGGHTGVVYSYAFGNDDIVIANLDGFTDGARNGEAASDDDICFCKRTTSEVKAISGVPVDRDTLELLEPLVVPFCSVVRRIYEWTSNGKSDDADVDGVSTSESLLRWELACALIQSFSSMAPAWPSLFDNQVISTNGNCPAILFQLAQMCVRDLKVEDIADMRELLWNMEWLRSRDLHFSLATRPISSSSFSASDDKTCVLRPPTSALEDSSALAPVASDGSLSVPEPSEYFYNLYAFSSRSDLPQHSGRNKMLEYWEKNVIPAIETYVSGSFKSYEMDYFFAQLREPLREGNAAAALKIAFTLCDGHVPSGCHYPDPDTDWSALQIDDLEVGGRYVIASENVDVADWSRDMLWTLGHSGTVRVVDPSGMVLLQVVNPVTSASEYWWYHVDNLRAMSSGTSVSEQSVTDFEASRTRLKMMNQQLIYSIARKSVFDLLQVAPEHAMKISIETRKTILARTSSSPLPLPSSLSVGHAPAATMQLTALLPKNPGNRYDLADLLRLAAAADLGCPEKVLSSEIGMLSDSTPGAPTENSSSLYLRPKISPKSALITVLQIVLNKQFERAAASPPPVMDRSASYDENASVMVTKSAKKHKKRGKQGALAGKLAAVGASSVAASAASSLAPSSSGSSTSLKSTQPKLQQPDVTPALSTRKHRYLLMEALLAELKASLDLSSAFLQNRSFMVTSDSPPQPLVLIHVPEATCLVLSFAVHPVLMDLPAGSSLEFFRDERCTDRLFGYFGDKRGLSYLPPLVVPGDKCYVRMSQGTYARYKFRVDSFTADFGLALWLCEEIYQKLLAIQLSHYEVETVLTSALNALVEYLIATTACLPANAKTAMYQITAKLINFALSKGAMHAVPIAKLSGLVKELTFVHDNERTTQKGLYSLYTQQLAELISLVEEVSSLKGGSSSILGGAWWKEFVRMAVFTRVLAQGKREIATPDAFKRVYCGRAPIREIQTAQTALASHDLFGERIIFLQNLPRTSNVAELKASISRFIVHLALEECGEADDQNVYSAAAVTRFGIVSDILFMPVDSEGQTVGYAMIDIGRADVIANLLTRTSKETFEFEGGIPTEEDYELLARIEAVCRPPDSSSGKSNDGNDSCSDGADPSGDVWACSVCTLENSLADAECAACGSPIPLEMANLARDVQSQSQSSRSEQPATGSEDATSSGWICTTCTFVNSWADTTCDACTMERSADLVPPSSAAREDSNQNEGDSMTSGADTAATSRYKLSAARFTEMIRVADETSGVPKQVTNFLHDRFFENSSSTETDIGGVIGMAPDLRRVLNHETSQYCSSSDSKVTIAAFAALAGVTKNHSWDNLSGEKLMSKLTSVKALSEVEGKTLAVYKWLRSSGYDLQFELSHYGSMDDVMKAQAKWTHQMDCQLIAVCRELSGRMGVLMLTDLCPSHLSANHAREYVQIASLETRDLRLRFAVLQSLNKLLVGALPLVNLRPWSDPSSLRSRIVSIRQLIFPGVKIRFFAQTQDNTTLAHSVFVDTNAKRPMVTIDRRKIAGKRGGICCNTTEASTSLAALRDPRRSLFASTMKQLSAISPSLLRAKRPTGASDPFVSFIVIFAGENVVGEGGPYRQLFNDISNELLASGNPLFIPTQNNVMKAGEFRERYMPKPSSTSKELLQMFEFVGILMGCCLRTGVRLNLRLAPLVWKMLVKQNLVLTDLESVDYSLCESLKFLEELASAPSDDPNEVLYDSFTTTLSDGTVVELKTGGQQLSVTKANAKEYIRLVKATRLQECKPQVDAMLRGLGKIVPVQLLQLCVWSELQQWVSGSLEIDVNLLKRHTRYSSGMSPEQFPHMEMFWKVLSSFSEENKRRFINFAWGQDTLPADDAEFDRTHTRLLIKAPPQDSGMNQDALLPKADTCFFNIELPVYSSEKIMREKLLLAITLCTSLDGDEQTASHDIYYAGDEIDDDAME
ncbi:hypothetical protein PI124_g515 [Phytophthora idaei]|nr:hypothetical protein PI124_g515 [Phytophthora idaei]